MKIYSRVEVYFHELNRALDEAEWLASHSTERDHGTHWIRSCEDTRASSDTVEKRKKKFC
jgi:hypothetical protein